MKWDELTAEQKNRLIHEKVFDIPAICPGKLKANRVDTPSRAGGIAFTYWELACDTCETVGTANSEYAIPKEHPPQVTMPAYSTDMNDAWKVIEKMRKQNTIDLFVNDDYIAKYRVRMDKRENWKQSSYSYSNTSMEDAICRVALMAVGVEIE